MPSVRSEAVRTIKVEYIKDADLLNQLIAERRHEAKSSGIGRPAQYESTRPSPSR